MATTYKQYRGDGVTKNFGVPFPYLDQGHVKVSINGESHVFTWLNASVVVINPAPAEDAVVDVRRVTPTGTIPVQFKDGSTLSEEDLNLLTVYSAFLAEESREAADTSLKVNLEGQVNADNRQIGNLADGTEDDHAVNLGQLEAALAAFFNTVESLRVNAAQSAQLAFNRANDSSGFADDSEASAQQSEQSAIAAEVTRQATEALRQQTDTIRQQTEAIRQQTELIRQAAQAAADNAAYTYRGTVTSVEDLKLRQLAGYCVVPAGGSTNPDLPVAERGILEVQIGATTYITQRYTTRTSRVFVRTYNASWTAWEELLLVSNFNTLLPTAAESKWMSKGIGEIYWVDDSVAGVDIPPTDSAKYRYIKLTANDSYNTGLLTSQTVSGTAPNLTATAVVNLSGTQLHGKTIRMLNTERRFLRPGNAGVVESSQNLAHAHTATQAAHNHNLLGSTSSAEWGSQIGAGVWLPYTPTWYSGTISSAQPAITVNSDGGTEARPNNAGITGYMRIK